MSTHLPEPLPLFWPLKPGSSAKAGVETLNDGRRNYWIKHDVLKNVTPRMLAWWFGHMEGDVEIQGQRFPRYLVWHPLDHVYARYVRRASDGSVGPGAQIALCEYLGRNPRYKIEAVSTVEKLDETGFNSLENAFLSHLSQGLQSNFETQAFQPLFEAPPQSFSRACQSNLVPGRNSKRCLAGCSKQ